MSDISELEAAPDGVRPKRARRISTETEEDVGKLVVESAAKVFRILGPGLLHNVYEAALTHELTNLGLGVQLKPETPVFYEGAILEAHCEVGMLVQNMVVVEIMSEDRNHAGHHARLLTFLKMSGRRLGFLANYGVENLQDAISPVVNGM